MRLGRPHLEKDSTVVLKIVSGLSGSLAVTLFAFSLNAAAKGEGTHGGDGRRMVNDRPLVSSTFIKNLKSSVENYLRSLQSRKAFLTSDAMAKSEFKVLLDPKLLDDVVQTKAYRFTDKAGDCGLFEDGFPRTASTRDFAPADEICIDLATVKTLGMTASQLAGIVIHEHVRHVFGSLDNNHDYGRAAKDTYWEAQTPPATGTCYLIRANWRGNLSNTSFTFDTSDLLLNRRVIQKDMLDVPVTLKAEFAPGERPNRTVEVTVILDKTNIKLTLPVFKFSENQNLYWKPADFDLRLSSLDSIDSKGRKFTFGCDVGLREFAPHMGHSLQPNTNGMKGVMDR
jgi:hypothetical protein